MGAVKVLLQGNEDDVGEMKMVIPKIEMTKTLVVTCPKCSETFRIYRDVNITRCLAEKMPTICNGCDGIMIIMEPEDSANSIEDDEKEIEEGLLINQKGTKCIHHNGKGIYTFFETELNHNFDISRATNVSNISKREFERMRVVFLMEKQ